MLVVVSEKKKGKDALDGSMTDGIPKDVDAVLCELRVVSRLPPYTKLNVQTLSYNYVGSVTSKYFNEMKRYFMSETGDSTVKYLNGLITRAIQAGRNYPNYQNEIIPRLQSITNAVDQLMLTYDNQEDVLGKLDNIKIHLQTNRIMEALQEQQDENDLYRPIPHIPQRDEGSKASHSPGSANSKIQNTDNDVLNLMGE